MRITEACRPRERLLLRRRLLPRCRDGWRLPPELYAAHLRLCGVEGPAAELARWGQAAFRTLTSQLEVEARRLARRRKWRDQGAACVLCRVLAKRVGDEEIVHHYRQRCRELQTLCGARGLLAEFDPRRLRIRRASAAESAVYPFPYFRWPRLIGSEGAVGELILPAVAADPATVHASDYWAAEALSMLIAAHEGIPGHGLYVARLLAPDMSLARRLAANQATIEGWAVYAESELYDALPSATRLIALRRQLHRAASAFLDPGLQQGLLTASEARRFLRRRVALSPRQAAQQVWRYRRFPGQSTAYFWGHTQLAALRSEAEWQLGPAFCRRAWHRCLLAQGLAPLSLLRRRVLDDLGAGFRLAA